VFWRRCPDLAKGPASKMYLPIWDTAVLAHFLPHSSFFLVMLQFDISLDIGNSQFYLAPRAKRTWHRGGDEDSNNRTPC